MADDGSSFRLPVLGSHYVIDPAEGIVRREADGGRASFHGHLASVNYLLRAQDQPLAGEWVSEQQFPTGPLFFRGPHLLPSRKLEERFGADRPAFEAAGEALAGRPVGHGDAATELPLFPRLPVRVVLWLADEEFPARASFMFDRTADQHLLLDGIWSATHVVVEHMLRVSG